MLNEEREHGWDMCMKSIALNNPVKILNGEK